MTARGHRFVIPVLLILLASPILAQQDERITRLEQRLDDLLRQAEEIRAELRELKGGTPAPAAVPDLTQVDVAAPAATPTTVASKALNPDISVIGTFLGHAGDHLDMPIAGSFEERDPLALDEVEVSLQTFIDPYAKGLFFIAVTPEEVDLEEGYAQFVTLPWGLTAKAGKTKATFGKANTWHTHQRPWIDQPMILTRFLGEEGVADVGVSVSKSIGNRFGAFVEATGEVYGGSIEGTMFERETDNDLLYNAHLKAFKDLGENSNIEIGASWMRGTSVFGGHNRLSGIDLTYRWKPLDRSIYRSFIARVEGVANRTDGFDHTLRGFYASADYQFARRWHAGVRLDGADYDARYVLGASPDFGVNRDHAVSATLSFWPSEFSQIRGQVRRSRFENGPTYNEVLLQLQFSIGAHGAHTF